MSIKEAKPPSNILYTCVDPANLKENSHIGVIIKDTGGTYRLARVGMFKNPVPVEIYYRDMDLTNSLVRAILIQGLTPLSEGGSPKVNLKNKSITIYQVRKEEKL